MSKVTLDISMSLDGDVAGPGADMDNPLGVGGMQLHEWVFGLDSWRKAHGEEGDATNVDDEVVQEGLRAQGAVVMGRKMFSGGSGPWEQVAPVLLRDGVRLFDNLGEDVKVEPVRAIESPNVTHVRYRVVKG